MLIRHLIYLFCIVVGATSVWASDSPSSPSMPDGVPKLSQHSKLKGYDESGGVGKSLYKVPIDGTIDLGLAAFVERIVERAQPEDRIVLVVKTFGGRVDAAVRIRDALLGTKASTIAYIDRRAISAGALISLACDTIIMSSGGSIGAATPVQGGGASEMKPTSEKVVSYMRAEMRATAEAKGRRADLAEAMVDASIEIKGVSAKDKLLTLTSDNALRLKLADAIVNSYDEVITILNLEKAVEVDSETHWAEKLARFLTDPTVSSLLMSFGFIGVLMELYSPGFGVGGIIGLTCLILFFLGQYAASLAGTEEILVLGGGVLLLLLEIFVIPGFGVAGVLGILLLITGFVMGMVEFGLPLDISFELGYAQEALELIATRLAVAMVVIIVAALFIMRRLPKMKLAKWMILEKSLSEEEGFVSEPENFEDFVGCEGEAISDLRPSGIAVFGGTRIDVQTQGDFIEAGEKIKVLKYDGIRLVVTKLK